MASCCAPNFGGLWEAAVKSVKKFLKYSLETSLLTFEELTIIIQAVMNSRPQLSLETFPEDGVHPLTPSHILMGNQQYVILARDVELSSAVEDLSTKDTDVSTPMFETCLWMPYLLDCN